MSNQEKIKEIFERWFNKTLTDGDVEQLRKFSDSSDFPGLLSSELKDQWNKIGPHPEFTIQRSREIGKEIFKRSSGNYITTTHVHRVHFLKTAWFRYAAAIVILFGIGAYLYNTQQKNNHPSITKTSGKVENDIYPGTNKAMLTLADGSTITLDSAVNGQLAIQKGAEIIKLSDGELSYKTTSTDADAVVSYNSMSTPKGGQYQLRLPDGTHVWLNAASSITYPTAFTGKTREVKVLGEVYFEVSKNKEKPFIVDINDKASIRVLGTHFNINSYDDEPNIKATLLEGSIEIQKGTKINMLVPGQQAIVDENIRVVNGINMQRAVAWKNGYFNFEGSSVEEFMRQLARWYDLQIVYKGKPDSQMFKGELGRDLVLSEVLETLKFFNIKYTIEGRTLTIE